MTARYPYPAAIDSYGNGGFRFAGMSHRGSILCLPSGIHAWPVADIAGLTATDLGLVLEDKERIDVLLLGSGGLLVMPDASVRALLSEAGLWIETMTTGAAARTYNVLLGEGRSVGAALIAVE